MQHGHGNKANRANTLQVKTFKDLEFKPTALFALELRSPLGAYMEFDNGYSISVVAGHTMYSTPRADGLPLDEYTAFEVAILKGEEWVTGEFFLFHHEQDVAGWQSREQIDKLMKQIQEK